MTPEVQAAVKNLKAVASKKDGGYSSPRCRGYADAVMDVYACLPEKQLYADLRTIVAALSEANERASILQTALHERTAERDEARKALATSEARRGELEGENAKLRGLLAPVAALHGLRPPHVVIARTVREAFTALNPQQEGSRDHV